MSAFLIVIMVITVCPTIVATVIYLSNRSLDYTPYLQPQRITAKQFFALYNICPEKWEHNPYSLNVKYRKETIVKDVIYDASSEKYESATIYQDEIISFKTYFDALRVKRFFENKARRQYNIETMRHRAELIKLWQKDLKSYCKKNFEQ